MTDSRLVIGAGGTGRTHVLRSLVAEVAGAAEVLTGSPLAMVTGERVTAALAAGPDVLAVDDLQWFDPSGLDALIAAAERLPVLATRRPATGGEPAPDALDHLAELLTRHQPAVRLGFCDDDAYGPALAAIRAEAAGRAGADAPGVIPTAEVAALLDATGGSVGLTADAVGGGWMGTGQVPESVVDAVATRIRRAGPAGAALVATWAVAGLDGTADALAITIDALDGDVDRDRAEREARAGGLVSADGSLLPLVRRCAAASATTAELGRLHDRVAEALAATDPVRAAGHLLEGDGALAAAPQILATAALEAAVHAPHDAPRYIDRAEQLRLPAGDASLLRALTSFHAGSADALAHLEDALASVPDDDRSAMLGYGIDLRELRLADAATRPIGGDLGAPLRALAEGLAGAPTTVDGGRTPLAKTYAGVANGLNELSRGALPEAVGSFTTAADDFDRLRPTAPFGITPHAVGALAALLVGDLPVIDVLSDQAIDHTSGGGGEALTHRLIKAFGRMIDGDYGPALDVLREHGNQVADGSGDGAGTPAEGDDDLAAALHRGGDGSGVADPEAGPVNGRDPRSAGADAGGSDPAFGSGSGGGTDPDRVGSQRDRLLLAALGAAVARRSGDTTRLRAAWASAERALLRPSACWLLADPLAELLAAGARVGDRRRIGPVVDAVVAQVERLPATGPGPVAAQWLRLQVALAAEDHDGVADAADALAGLEPVDERSRARIAAARIWAGLDGARHAEEADGDGGGDALRPSEDDVVVAAEALLAIGDGWEASRILGQAALDEPDPKAARRMLELARVSTAEHVDSSTGDGLAALGLSERESEVALLVVEGRTHKEVGAQLFISPKTVEHHVAKIRQKVGASSRAELLSIIREAVGQT